MYYLLIRVPKYIMYHVPPHAAGRQQHMLHAARAMVNVHMYMYNGLR
jgi:hypothetical protein